MPRVTRGASKKRGKGKGGRHHQRGDRRVRHLRRPLRLPKGLTKKVKKEK